MNDTEQGLRQHERSQRKDALPASGRIAAFLPLGTAAGCAAIAATLWSTLPQDALSWWLGAGALLAAVQWQMRRRLACAVHALAAERCEGGDWQIVVRSALLAGLFWSAAGCLLLPDGSMVHRLVLLCVLAGIMVLWLPLFALARLTLLLFAVPVLLPIAFDLLTSPQAPQTTMGSLFLLLFGAFAAAAQVTNRILHADRAARRALYHQATHDPLVGLANRAEFHRRVAEVDAAAARPYAILFVDLDHFKEVNDTAGHAVGDELLREVGAILRLGVRKGDTAARLGGDEFAVLMADCEARDAALVAGSILERINALHRLGSRAYQARVSASIGIACHPTSGPSAQRVLEAADRACYAAKRTGRNRIEIAAVPACDVRAPVASRYAESKLGLIAHPSI
jgi:diguanylate cyclase (GGDEF)-like protein